MCSLTVVAIYDRTTIHSYRSGTVPVALIRLIIIIAAFFSTRVGLVSKPTQVPCTVPWGLAVAQYDFTIVVPRVELYRKVSTVVSF